MTIQTKKKGKYIWQDQNHSKMLLILNYNGRDVFLFFSKEELVYILTKSVKFSPVYRNRTIGQSVSNCFVEPQCRQVSQ